MTEQNRNPFESAAPLPEFTSPLQTRSVAPMILGIFNISLAVLGVVSAGFTAVMMSSQIDPGAPPSSNPAWEAMKNPAYRNAMLILLPIGCINSLVLVTSGVGLIRYRKWGRTLAFAYILLTVGLTVGSSITNYYYVIQPMVRMARDSAESAQNPAAFGGAIGGVIGGVLGGCGGLIYPFILGIFMIQNRVRQSLK